ncbi:MAG: nucleotidyl transferase AbiEii/AbiGii toxin family protein [Patescibacteria group bacterium]|nr:nucleotidyl transferase AbiEii/AbiGii toxin family protein [Patescibacteria group bacterium]
MISIEVLEKLSKQYQMGLFPNIIREYFQHVFLSELYKLPDSRKLLFKGGTALRVIYSSPRFSEDLDFSLFGVVHNRVKSFIEELFVHVLAEMSSANINVEIGDKIGVTSGGYFGVATFRLSDYPPVSVEINISTRNGKTVRGEVDSVASDFTPTYTIIHLPQNDLVEEKIFGALLERKKPRDFYDLYFMMRKGMISGGQKKKLAEVKDKILADAKKNNFKGELGTFLPMDQHQIIKDFPAMLERELNRQLSGV